MELHPVLSDCLRCVYLHVIACKQISNGMLAIVDAINHTAILTWSEILPQKG